MKKNKEELKTYFETGDKPTQEQYSDLIDSYIDSKQPSGVANRRFVINENGEVSVSSEQNIPEYTLSEIVGNKLALLKDGVVVKEVDLTTYLDDTNLARLVSGTVDANGIATFKRDDDSVFTLDFSDLRGDGGVTPTDLSFKESLNQGTIESSTGKSAVIPVADKNRAGLMKADFYEEGAFTPLLYAGHDSSNSEKQYVTTAPTGNYTRIGNVVHFWISFRNISDPSGGVIGSLSIGGLPFNCDFDSESLKSVNINKMVFASASKNNRPDPIVPSNVSGDIINRNITFRSIDKGGSLHSVSFNDGNGGVDLVVSGTYKTNIYIP